MEDKNILSIKIVSVDHYNSFPIPNLDTTRAEFRKKPVKQVPVIRIFGITQNKKKICANVHGVFPYFYIPCAETDQEKINQLMNDLATQIDKSVNISFGQSNASSHHIFKISLVKGTPFYGYHKSEHQFLRIQLYNPNIVKRVSNLLQGGLILGKQFQPHESHIPYILKFFIDYNLFGMSYLHIPLQFVHTREGDSTRYKKRSVSHMEVDFKAIYILNRIAAEQDQDSTKAANPGIESIWEDERLRRSSMDPESVPPLETTVTQERVIPATESDIFYRTVLKDRLAENSSKSIMDSTMPHETFRECSEVKKKFDLKNFLDASVYAAEFSQNSFITKSSESSEMKSSFPSQNESVASQTIDDLESQFLNYSYSEPTDSEIKEKEEMFDMLEEYPDNDLEDDSLLAPLTQRAQDATSFVELSSKLKESFSVDDSDKVSIESDDEMFNDLNVTVADMEMFSQYVEDDKTFPQFDGVDDEIDDLSPSEITKRNDAKKNYHPQPGPSHLYISPIRIPLKQEAPSPSSNILNSQDIQNNLKQLANHFKTSSVLPVANFSQSSNEDYDYDDDDGDDDHINSFYDKSMMIDEFDSSNEETQKKLNNFEDAKPDKSSIIITPAKDPPDPTKILLDDFDFPKCVHPSPFYSNPKDVTGKKEVGHNMLEIPRRRLCDLEDFKSVLFEKNQLKCQAGMKLVCENTIVVYPQNDPPSFSDALNWLKASSGIEDDPPEIESPVKEKRERTLMVLELDDDVKEDLDATLVPATPTTPDTIPNSYEKAPVSLSRYVEEKLTMSARGKRKRMKKSFSRRFQEIMKAKAEASMEVDTSSPDLETSAMIDFNSEELDSTSQSSESSAAKSTDPNSSVIVLNANVQEDLSFNNCSDITGPSLNNTYGFKMKLESLQSNNEHTDLTILSMELHVQTRTDLKPDPMVDPISAIFYCIDGHYSGNEMRNINGIIAYVDDDSFRYVKQGVAVTIVKTEMELLDAFFNKVREFDPDIFAGYEIETASWGYLVQRGYVYNMNLNNALSRMPTEKKEKTAVDEEEQFDQGDYFSEQKIPGRILLDVWRLMKHEIALTSYTFENVCYHVLHRRYPKHAHSFLSLQWKQPLRMWIVLDYYAERAKTLIEILKQLDLIGRTCELAKLFGIQFYEVLSRGSQFRVESMMIRIAKRRNYVPVSPSVQQRAHMRAPEYIPLILEPESRFYSDPVIVLDFQSLYPSIIIAYNYCFSTCLGRVEHLSKASSQPFEFGAYQLRVSPARLQYLLDNDLITASPCGVVYVKESVKEGVLPRMLREILDTRLMVKQSMKIHKSNSALQRVLHSRQLGLKLIANVTYGYTAANFSGRMPAIEVGDSVVSKGRETLERAIKMVESNKEWGCRVCYGDTDSMFVLVPGRSREEAFKIGQKIADAVTNDNPHPIKLKLEKVYQPCILQTKKRYVGFMYESADQTEPVYEAKGIETVRRDGCPAAAKILEKTLRILFETCDVSKVKEYVCRQFTKILTGRCSFQDLTFAKEFRGINGYKEKACVPALTLTRKSKLTDPRDEPRRGERVPFLVVNGAPGLPLIKLVRNPLEVLNDENYKINSIYYITKAIIPPLNRCLLLIGANAFDWFAELPRRQQFIPLMSSATSTSKKGTISQFFSTANCVTCDNQCHQSICSSCRNDSQKSVFILSEKSLALEQKMSAIKSICESCCRRSFETECISLDCPVLYALVKAKRDYKQVDFYRDILDEF